MTVHSLRWGAVTILTLALITAAACGDQLTPPGESQEVHDHYLPLPQRAIITEQVLLVADLPKIVTYTAHLPLGALRAFVSELSTGRERILRRFPGRNARLPEKMDVQQASTPSLAMLLCWDLVKEKQSEETWVLLDFQVDLNGKLANVKTRVIEHTRGIWSASAESGACKRTSAILAEEGLSVSVKSLNSRRRLVVSLESHQDDHFPSESDHENEQCWRISKITKGTYLGLAGTLYSMEALAWDSETRSHAATEEVLTRTYLGGIGFVEGSLGQHALAVVEITDPSNDAFRSSTRTAFVNAVVHFGEALKAGKLNDVAMLTGVGILMELLPDRHQVLASCVAGTSIDKSALARAMSVILLNLEKRRLIRSRSHVLQSYLSQ
jgi:hypothetical protein